MTDFTEKRDYLRIQVNCDIRFKQKDSEKIYIGHCTSLSASGVSFVSKKKLAFGEKLEVSVYPQNHSKPSIIGIIEIVRVEELKSNEFEFGAMMQVLVD